MKEQMFDMLFNTPYVHTSSANCQPCRDLVQLVEMLQLLLLDKMKIALYLVKSGLGLVNKRYNVIKNAADRIRFLALKKSLTKTDALTYQFDDGSVSSSL